MFCAKAGAKSVIGVDMSDIIHSTTDIIRENKFQDIITLVKGRLEDVQDLQVHMSVLIWASRCDLVIYKWAAPSCMSYMEACAEMP